METGIVIIIEVIMKYVCACVQEWESREKDDL